MSEIKLEPCPFCGGEAELKDMTFEIEGMNVGKTYFVECENGCMEYFKTRKEAVEAWNKRAERHGHWETYESEKTYADFSFWSVKALSCSECKRLVLNSSDYCPHCGARMEKSI